MFFGIEFSIIVLALFTGYVGYQFNLFAKKKERFLIELKESYSMVYSPMFVHLRHINSVKAQEKKSLLIDQFFAKFSEPDSSVRLIESSYLLEYYFELYDLYEAYKISKTRSNEQVFNEKLDGFYIMIENEYWEAHDAIYASHLQIREDTFRNPFLVAVFAVFRSLYYLTTFALGLGLLILYFAVWNKLFPTEVFPELWNIPNSIFLLTIISMFYVLLLMIKSFAIKKNRRKNKVFMNIKKKLLK